MSALKKAYYERRDRNRVEFKVNDYWDGFCYSWSRDRNRVEFKGVSSPNVILIQLVEIETEWNLK